MLKKFWAAFFESDSASVERDEFAHITNGILGQGELSSLYSAGQESKPSEKAQLVLKRYATTKIGVDPEYFQKKNPWQAFDASISDGEQSSVVQPALPPKPAPSHLRQVRMTHFVSKLSYFIKTVARLIYERFTTFTKAIFWLTLILALLIPITIGHSPLVWRDSTVVSGWWAKLNQSYGGHAQLGVASVVPYGLPQLSDSWLSRLVPAPQEMPSTASAMNITLPETAQHDVESVPMDVLASIAADESVFESEASVEAPKTVNSYMFKQEGSEPEVVISQAIENESSTDIFSAKTIDLLKQSSVVEQVKLAQKAQRANQIAQAAIAKSVVKKPEKVMVTHDKNITDLKWMIQSNQYLTAMKQLQTYVQSYPNIISYRILLGELFLKQKQYVSVEKLVTDGVPLFGEKLPLIELLARAYIEQNRLSQALDLLKKHDGPIEVTPGVYSLMANIYQRMHSYDLSEQIYSEMLQVFPNNGRWWIGLGVSREATGRYGGARQAFERALSDRRLPEALLLYANQRINSLKKYETQKDSLG